MKKNEVKYGAILSYVLIALNSLYGLVIAPYILGTIGESEYGVYKTIAAITASVSVLELGLGGTMQRFLAKYLAEKDYDKCYNFSAMGLIQALFLALAMATVGGFLYFSLDGLYSATFTATEMMRAKQLFLVLIVYTSLHIFENLFFGIITGYNKFTFTNTVKIILLISKILIYVVILPIFKNSLVIVLTSLLLELSTILLELGYTKYKLKHKIKLTRWDNAVFRESFAYTILLFVQSLLIQFNGNIDNIVIGATISTSAVTIYSFAIQIYGMYELLATAVSGVILPTITNQIHNGATSKELEKTVVKFGRVQWMFLGIVLAGLVCFGKEFFNIWLGEKFVDCYYLSIILVVPVTFPLVVNVCLAILKAKNLLMFRTIAMGYSVAINAILTIIGVKYFGYWAAAAGTALSTIIGSVISLNIYYHKKLGINVFKLYFAIGKRSTLCILVSGVVGALTNLVISGTWFALIVKGIVFVVVYFILLWIYGLYPEEKKYIFRRVETR